MSDVDRLFDDIRIANQPESDDVGAEVERIMAQARIANRQRTAAKQRKQANRARAKAKAEKMVRDGSAFRPKLSPAQDAITAHRRDMAAKRRQNESDAMRDRLAAEQRHQRRRENFARVNEALANFLKE